MTHESIELEMIAAPSKITYAYSGHSGEGTGGRAPHTRRAAAHRRRQVFEP